jgi:hypothetical protein
MIAVGAVACALALVAGASHPKHKGRTTGAREEVTLPPAPRVGPSVGFGIPLSGGTTSVRLGVKAPFYDLASVADGLEIVGLFSIAIGTSAPANAGAPYGFELMPAIHYRHRIGSTAFSAGGFLAPGLFHGRVVTQTAFVGNQVTTQWGFIGRAALTFELAVNDKLSIFLEPVNLGVVVVTPTTFELALALGMTYSF